MVASHFAHLLIEANKFQENKGLRCKVFSCPLPASIIPEINVCMYDPWDLPGNLERERYFPQYDSSLKIQSFYLRRLLSSNRNLSPYWFGFHSGDVSGYQVAAGPSTPNTSSSTTSLTIWTLILAIPSQPSESRYSGSSSSWGILANPELQRKKRVASYRSVTTLHPSSRAEGGTAMVESYVVDVPHRNTKDDMCIFMDTIVRCDLQLLA